MKTIDQFVKEKKQSLLTLGSNASVLDALQLMAKHDVGAILVIDDKKLLGIFSERDYARKVILKGKTSTNTKIKEIMTSKVKCVRLKNTIDECMSIMTKNHIRHLPILSESNVVGIISIGDVVKEKISDQQFIINQLEQYIMN